MNPLALQRLGRLLDLIRMIGPNIDKLLSLLSGIDLGKISELLTAIGNFAGLTSDPKTKEGIVERVNAGMGIAKLWASMTSTTVDDSLVALIDKVAGNPQTLDWIATLVASFLSKAPTTAAAVAACDNLEADEAIVTASGIDWSSLISLVKLIMELIAAFRKPA